MSKGLYKIENGALLFAEVEIYFNDGEIISVSDYENTDTEINGWRWFASKENAMIETGYQETESRDIL